MCWSLEPDGVPHGDQPPVGNDHLAELHSLGRSCLVFPVLVGAGGAGDGAVLLGTRLISRLWWCFSSSVFSSDQQPKIIHSVDLIALQFCDTGQLIHPTTRQIPSALSSCSLDDAFA